MRIVIVLLSVLLLMVGAVAAQDEQTYVVQPGDSIAGIANAFGVSEEAILVRNNIIDPSRIRVGQVLFIPASDVVVNPSSHVVQPGETLYDISLRYNIPVEALVQANLLGNPSNITPGQVLTLPPTGGPTTTTPVTTSTTTTTVTTGPTLPAQPLTYVVDIGETLRTIAAQFGTTWNVLAAYNGIVNPNYIQAGSTITIPPASYLDEFGQGGPVVVVPTPVVVQPSPVTYTVRAGDTLEAIAQRYNVTIESLRVVNGIENNRLIFPGDVLVIPPTGGPVTTVPVVTPRTVVNGVYTVQAGDTMFAIAASFGVDVYELARANGILNLNSIYTGQALIIPGY